MLQEKAALHAERKTHGVDLDGVRFQRMVDAERAEVTRLARERRDPGKKRKDARLDEPPVSSEERVSSSDAKRVAVHVRVRPLSPAERSARAVDVVTCVADGGASSALVAVHEPRTKVDCTRHVESSLFEFDGAFDANASNADVYAVAIEPLVRLCVEGARGKLAGNAERGGDDGLFSANATVFAYGQTGSGKTHTMTSLYEDVARDVCLGARDRNLRVEVSFYEVYAGKCFDLLAERKRVNALEDARGRVRVVGLTERVVREPHEVLALAEEGAACRKTSRTDANASSSRSHSVFQIALKPDSRASETASESLDESQSARLSLVDLAGSERGADRGKAVSESVRREGAEINTSLLALKECIRALSVEKIAYAAEPAGCTPNDAEKARVPFRGSKLTTVLRDAFVGKRSRTVLLAHISPGHDAAEHTVNTLRYATRLKEMGGADVPREKGERRAFPEKIPPLRERDANATEKSEFSAFSLRPTRAALAEKRRVAFESGRTLLDAHRMLARASEAEAEALESAERALAAVERDAAGGGEGDKDESAARRAARDEFHAACDVLAATLERRAALEQSARRAAANARAARAEEQAAVDAADVR
jgi:kinesin family protein 2/24